MRELKKRTPLHVQVFQEGDKVVIANPGLLIQSENLADDVFTVVKTKLSFGDWLGVTNDRTGRSYVMGHGEYAFL